MYSISMLRVVINVQHAKEVPKVLIFVILFSTDCQKELLTTLKQVFKFKSFRPGQLETVQRIVKGGFLSFLNWIDVLWRLVR